jgi:hypothetical protein
MNETKPIKISWTAPNGKNYAETILMTLKQYENFVNSLLEIKKGDEKEK